MSRVLTISVSENCWLSRFALVCEKVRGKCCQNVSILFFIALYPVAIGMTVNEIRNQLQRTLSVHPSC